jgi:PBP1b-binding outer membrane lipoprotein LpoB
MFYRKAVLLLLVSVLLFAGCTKTISETPKEKTKEIKEKETEPTEKKEEKPITEPPQKLKVSENATKIYLGMLQTGLSEVVVDVKEDEVLIAFLEDKELSNEALIYYAFGLSQKFEPTKQKTTVLIFLDDGKKLEASADNADIKALSEGKLSEEEFKKKIRWIK